MPLFKGQHHVKLDRYKSTVCRKKLDTKTNEITSVWVLNLTRIENLSNNNYIKSIPRTSLFTSKKVAATEKVLSRYVWSKKSLKILKHKLIESKGWTWYTIVLVNLSLLKFILKILWIRQKIYSSIED